MKRKILQVATAITIIITLTMTNFMLLSVNMIAYAVDTINGETSTNHKNVEFMAYFKDQNNNRITSKEAFTNEQDLKVYMQIAVKNEGYFNGKITLNDANFKFNDEKLSTNVDKIEDNTIYLNQIKAGDVEEIEVSIQLLKEDDFDLSLIKKESKININGIYRDSTEKNIDIAATRNLQLKMVSPYNDQNTGSKLNQNIITNKVLKYDGVNKRILQVQVESGIQGNLFPIKSSSSKIVAPKISNKYPEKVLVNTIDVLTTNGNQIVQNEWNYNTDTGLVEINIDNNEVQNKVKWLKSQSDVFIITYIFDDTTSNFEDQTSKINTEIKLYDLNNTTITAENEMGIDNNEKNGIIEIKNKQKEESIYKGKFYSAITRDVTYTTSIDVKLNNVANSISLSENEKIEGENLSANINSVYKNSRISKSELTNVLGENGSLIILNAQNQEQLAIITKDSVSDENGYINFEYSNNIEKVKFITNKPEKIGKISIETTKTINSIEKDIVKKATDIKYSSNAKYNDEVKEVDIQESISKIELKETETSAKLDFLKNDLTTISTNKGFEMNVILESRDEKNELFKNPNIKIELPEKIEKIENVDINLLNEEELKIVSSRLEGNTLEIQLSGEQTKYKNEAIEGAKIRIIADLTVNKKSLSSTEKVKLLYTNENAINYKNALKTGEEEKNINIVSYLGIVTTSKIADYGIEVVNNEGNKNAKLAIAGQSKTVNIEKEIINNQESEISDVKVLGTFPTKNAVKDINNIDIDIKNSINLQGIDLNRVKIYYSVNENATEDITDSLNSWTETITDSKNSKKYLITIDKLGVSESVNFSYEIQIPENLEYNKTAQEGNTIYYTDSNLTQGTVKLENITLETGKGPIVETKLKALIGGEEKTEVKEGSFISYVITAENIGTEDITNVKLNGKIPENTVYVEPNKISDEMTEEEKEEEPFVEYPEIKDVEFNLEHISVGESISKTYLVKVKDGTNGKQISNVIDTSYGEINKKSNEVVNQIKVAQLKVALFSADSEDGILKNGYSYRYVVEIENISDTEKNNVKIEFKLGDSIDLEEIYYVVDGEKSISEENNNYINIDSIKAGEKLEICALIKSKVFMNSETVKASISAKVNCDNDIYYSNDINLISEPINIDTTITSENSDGYVKSGDIITYSINVKNNGEKKIENFKINNTISDKVTVFEVDKLGQKLETDKYTIEDNNKLNLIDEIEAGENVNYEIKAVVNKIPGNNSSIEIINNTKLLVDSIEIVNKNITHILSAESQNDPSNPNNQNGPNSSNPGNQDGVKIGISGVAWLDENLNGQRDENEQVLQGIIVRLLNTKTNEFVKNTNNENLEVKTNSNGFYSFDSISKGEYIVVFEYDTAKYVLTVYEKDGIDNKNTSKVVNKDININGNIKTLGVTDIIKADNSNIANMNIGLQVLKNFDLKLDKYISKVVIQNSKGTVTKEYNDTSFAKAEIDAKKVNGTTVVVEYTIKVTNNGEIDAYVKKIADNLSKDYKFSSELNKDWYQSGDTIYNSSLTNEKIQPGKSKEIKLIVTKQMTENNTGLVNNTANIVESYNQLGLIDKDMAGSADLILSIKTGQIITAITLILSTIVIISSGAYIIGKILITRRII